MLIYSYELQTVITHAKDEFQKLGTPVEWLNIACRYKKLPVLKWLVTQGGDVNAYGEDPEGDDYYLKDGTKLKPIYCAIRYNNLEAVKWLLNEAGATTEHEPVKDDGSDFEYEIKGPS